MKVETLGNMSGKYFSCILKHLMYSYHIARNMSLRKFYQYWFIYYIPKRNVNRKNLGSAMVGT